MPNKLQQQALPNELWAKVFSVLAPASEDDAADATLMCDYQQFHKLRLVCKQFHAVFKQQPELCSHLVVSGEASLASAPNLLLWLVGNSSIVRSFEPLCHGTVTIGALVALICADSQLCRVDICRQEWIYIQPVINILPAFTSLTSCRLSTGAGLIELRELDVAPLGQLPKLSHIELSNGRIWNFHLLPHLTKVCFDHAIVSDGAGNYMYTPAWACIGQLCELQVIASHVHKVHPKGLAALTNLKVLKCVDALISAHDDRNNLAIGIGYGGWQLPSEGLTDLMYLSKVYLRTTKSDSGRIMLPGMLRHLTALQDLSIVTYSSVVLKSSFTQLPLLTQLVIRSEKDLTHDTDCLRSLMHLEYVDWKSLQWLRNLEIGYFQFRTREAIWELAQLEHLDSICIQGNCADSGDTSCLAVKHQHTIMKHVTNV